MGRVRVFSHVHLRCGAALDELGQCLDAKGSELKGTLVARRIAGECAARCGARRRFDCGNAWTVHVGGKLLANVEDDCKVLTDVLEDFLGVLWAGD
eukprot:1365998-Amorphochlora_amoeboformis.AAC.2